MEVELIKADLGRVTTLLAIRQEETKKLKTEIVDLHRRLDEGRRAQQVRAPVP